MLLLLFFATTFLSVQALEVSSGSPCADTCQGPTLTFSTDLSCNDNDYTSTDRGTLMKQCLECESTSTYVDSSATAPQDNDLLWLLFNAKYTLQYCLIQSTDSTSNLANCESQCTGLFPALTPSWFANPRPAQYDYCSISDDAFTTHAEACASCLQSEPGSVVLGNLITYMKSGCDSRADAHEAQTIPIQRELFNTETVASLAVASPSSSNSLGSSTSTPTDAFSSSVDLSSRTTSTNSPTSRTDSSSTVPTSTTATSDSQSQSDSDSTMPYQDPSTTSLSAAAVAGIGVGCGLGALLLGLGLFFYIRYRRNTVRVPRSVFEKTQSHMQMPGFGGGKGYGQVHESNGVGHGMEMGMRNGQSPAEAYGHQRFEMGAEKGGVGNGWVVQSSELDGRAIGR